MVALSNDPPIYDREDLNERFPEEVWQFFSNADLTQLVADACEELYRRNSPLSVRFGGGSPR